MICLCGNCGSKIEVGDSNTVFIKCGWCKSESRGHPPVIAMRDRPKSENVPDSYYKETYKDVHY